MKAKKNRVGTKVKIRAIKERERRTALTVTVALLIIIILVASVVIYSTFYSSSEGGGLPEPTLQFEPLNPDPELKAVIVDHLSLTASNKTFTRTAASILTQANYTVDYYSSEKITVNFYRYLPTGGYKLIIFRVHSALDVNGQPPLALFTSEPWDSRKHVNEQLTDQVTGVTFLPYNPGDKSYFGIVPKFIRLSMKGEFSNSVIIAMGCNGLTYTDMAEAFIEKGAEVYISWNHSPMPYHTDLATVYLLRNFLIEKQTIKRAVENAMKTIGPDPYDAHNVLLYYPLEAGEQTIENSNKSVSAAISNESFCKFIFSLPSLSRQLSSSSLSSPG